MKIFMATAPMRRKMDRSMFEPCLATRLLSQILTQYGCQVDVVSDIDVELQQDPATLVVRTLRADLICLSSTSFTWAYMKEFMQLLDQAGEHPPILLGGVHPTLVPEYVIRSTSADVVVVGEGERAICELVDHFRGQRALKDIQGIYYRQDGEILSTPKRELLTSQELGELPTIKWNDFTEEPSYLTVQTARGCLMHCKFCAVPFHRTWRPIPLPSILDNLAACIEVMPSSGSKYIPFADDCTTANPQIFIELLKAVSKQFPQLSISFQGRVRDLLKPGLLETVAGVNMQAAPVGVECGYAEGLKKVTKGLRLEEVLELGRRARACGAGPGLLFCFMIGLPWETSVEIKTTLDFAFSLSDLSGGMIQVCWWNTMPGNALFKQVCDTYGFDNSLFDQRDWSINRDFYLKTHPWLTLEQMYRMRDYARSLASSHPHVFKMGSGFSLPWDEADV